MVNRLLRHRFLTPMVAFLMITGAVAQEYPTRPVTLVVSFAPGGSTDMTARLIASKMRPEIGQPIVVDNRPGAGGSIGVASVARAAPDGYTLLMAVSSHALNASLMKNLPYDMKKDFTAIGQIVSQPLVLVVHKDFPARTLQELVDYLRQDRGPVNYGSAGIGTNYHLAGSLLNNLTDGKMVHVPYKGGAPATTAIMAGEVQVLIGVITELLPQVRAGTVRALGVTTRERSPHLPDVPAIREVLPTFEMGTWSGLLAPAGTPPSVVARLNQALNKALEDPDVRETVARQGSQVMPRTAEAFGEFVARELESAARLVELSGVSRQ